MKSPIDLPLAAALAPEDIAALDKVCRGQGVSRLDAVEAALRWYIDWDGDLPSADDLQEDIEA